MQKSIKAGLALNTLLEEEDPHYKSKINSFIERFSVKMREIHEMLKTSRHKAFILMLIRDNYIRLIDTKFQENIPIYPINLLKNYVITLTKPTFFYK